MAVDYPTIAELRYPLVLARREQIPDSNNGILEVPVDVVRVFGKVEDAYFQTFYTAEEADRPVTHFVWIRWLGWLTTTHCILRDTRLPDGTGRRDLFRIRRSKELNGRKRFLELECELEQRSII